MSYKLVRIILLFTLLSVAGQLAAFNQHCDMSEVSNKITNSMQHNMQHGLSFDSEYQSMMEETSAMQTMPCCDMSAGCDMASCVALMLNYFNNRSELFNQSSLVNVYKPSFHSFELDSFYKPPIFS